MTLQGDFQITAIHFNTFKINAGSFSPFKFLPARPIGMIYFKLSSSSLFQNVVSDYMFSLQPTNQLAKKGKIIFNFPYEWGSILSTTSPISSITGSWTKASLSYSILSYNSPVMAPLYRVVEITTDFDLPSKGSIYVSVKKFLNPASLSSTNIF